MAKRLFDLIGAGIGLVLLSPLLLLIAVWVKLDSPGPVFYRQERVGRFGRLFRIHKFRTMHVDADRVGLALTVGADPRVTRAGALLRRYKLDELPQLLDVILGDMSLVGPRPEVPKYVAHYPNDVRELVLSVRPGITDLASIEYRDENALLGKSANPEQTYLEQVLPAKLRFNVEYARRHSVLGDLKIILCTLVAIVS